MRLDLDKILEQNDLRRVNVHMSYDNGAFVDEYDIDLEDLFQIVVKMMRRDGIIPIEGD